MPSPLKRLSEEPENDVDTDSDRKTVAPEQKISRASEAA